MPTSGWPSGPCRSPKPDDTDAGHSAAPVPAAAHPRRRRGDRTGSAGAAHHPLGLRAQPARWLPQRPAARGLACHRQRQPGRQAHHLEFRRARATLAADCQPAARQRRRRGGRRGHREPDGAGPVRHHDRRPAGCAAVSGQLDAGCRRPGRPDPALRRQGGHRIGSDTGLRDLGQRQQRAGGDGQSAAAVHAARPVRAGAWP